MKRNSLFFAFTGAVFVAGVVVAQAAAWAPPTVAPPGGQPVAPVDQGNLPQAKDGDLGTNSVLKVGAEDGTQQIKADVSRFLSRIKFAPGGMSPAVLQYDSNTNRFQFGLADQESFPFEIIKLSDTDAGVLVAGPLVLNPGGIGGLPPMLEKQEGNKLLVRNARVNAPLGYCIGDDCITSWAGATGGGGELWKKVEGTSDIHYTSGKTLVNQLGVWGDGTLSPAILNRVGDKLVLGGAKLDVQSGVCLGGDRCVQNKFGTNDLFYGAGNFGLGIRADEAVGTANARLSVFGAGSGRPVARFYGPIGSNTDVLWGVGGGTNKMWNVSYREGSDNFEIWYNGGSGWTGPMISVQPAKKVVIKDQLEVASAAAGSSGLKFTNLTNTDTAKFLTVDSTGQVILRTAPAGTGGGTGASVWETSFTGIKYTLGAVGIGRDAGSPYKLDVAGQVNASAYFVNGEPLSVAGGAGPWAMTDGVVRPSESARGVQIGGGSLPAGRVLGVTGAVAFGGGAYVDEFGNVSARSVLDPDDSVRKLDLSDSAVSLNTRGAIQVNGSAEPSYFAGRVGIGGPAEGERGLELRGTRAGILIAREGGQPGEIVIGARTGPGGSLIGARLANFTDGTGRSGMVVTDTGGTELLRVMPTYTIVKGALTADTVYATGGDGLCLTDGCKTRWADVTPGGGGGGGATDSYWRATGTSRIFSAAGTKVAVGYPGATPPATVFQQSLNVFGGVYSDGYYLSAGGGVRQATMILGTGIQNYSAPAAGRSTGDFNGCASRTGAMTEAGRGCVCSGGGVTAQVGMLEMYAGGSASTPTLAAPEGTPITVSVTIAPKKALMMCLAG